MTNKDIRKTIDIDSKCLYSLRNLIAWCSVGVEFNESILELKNKKDAFKNNKEKILRTLYEEGFKTKESLEILNKYTTMRVIRDYYKKFKKRNNNLFRKCCICGDEIFLKRKNSNKKYCKECARKVKNKQIRIYKNKI